MLRKLTLFLSLVLLNTSLNAQLDINYSHEGNADSVKLNFAKTEFSKYLKVAIFNSRIVQNVFNIKLIKKGATQNGSFSYTINSNGRLVNMICVGEDEAAIGHAMYTILESLGFQFDITGVVVPTVFKTAIFKSDTQSITPFTRWRGIRQHVNFPMDISSYPLAEAKEYLNNLVRMRFNKIAIHSYPNLWHEVNFEDSVDYAGNFFYGRQHDIPNMQIFTNHIRFNDKIFSIPEIEKSYANTPVKSKMAVAWMRSFIEYAQSIGLRVQVSIEPRSKGDIPLITRTVKSVINNYPSIDELELITEEMGGWGNATTKAQVNKIAVAQFGESILQDTMVTNVIKNSQPDLDVLFFQLGRNITALKLLEKDQEIISRSIKLNLGIYCVINDYAKVAFYIAKKYLPNNSIAIMPGHGSKRVANYLPNLIPIKSQIAPTTIYSWIEFDGLMFTQQNANEGIYDLMKYLKVSNGAQQQNTILFNHWRTAENRTSARYAALNTLYGPIPQLDFYKQYAAKLQINNVAPYVQAMQLLEKIDWIATNDLPNIGFCWVGAWREGGPYTWINSKALKNVQGLYSQVNYNLKKAMYNVGSTSGSNYLTFLLNRSEASKLYLDAFEKGIQVQNIKQDSVGKFSPTQQLNASVICNDALTIFNKYLQKHVELMPDRGCEGTLINFWHAPIYGLKVIRYKYAGIPIDADPVIDNRKDAPPLPIYFKKN